MARSMEPPEFKYHPDPIATGSIVASTEPCVCCGRARGLLYTGPTYGPNELDGGICPWCIKSGDAHARLEVEFTDAAGVGGYVLPNTTPPGVVDEVAHRTPGFSGWQQERWLTCCQDAMAFLGCAGHAELVEAWPGAVAAVMKDCGLDGDEWESFFKALDVDDGPTAYVFRCLHCGSLDAYQDCH
jgi:uncharacterized protein CbrC (UPF0167 family)